MLYMGLGHTTASRGVVFLYLSPFVVAFGAHYLIPGDRLTVTKVLGLAAALFGLAVAVGEGSRRRAGQRCWATCCACWRLCYGARRPC